MRRKDVKSFCAALPTSKEAIIIHFRDGITLGNQEYVPVIDNDWVEDIRRVCVLSVESGLIKFTHHEFEDFVDDPDFH
jgi:hypothetical protein